jgi:hypothetical protein
VVIEESRWDEVSRSKTKWELVEKHLVMNLSYTSIERGGVLPKDVLASMVTEFRKDSSHLECIIVTQSSATF